MDNSIKHITNKDFVEIFKNVSTVMTEKKTELCEMDAKMGDGDLGITMSKGWSAVFEAAKEFSELESEQGSGSDIGKLLVKCGMKLSSAAPSTMGTLMASGLMSGGKNVSGKTEMGIREFAEFLMGFCDGIIKRGKCQAGDRTVLDSILPAAKQAESEAKDCADNVLTISAIEAIQAASDNGLEQTRQMKPKFGKAAVFADKAADTVDQGAMAGNLVIRCFCEYLKERLSF